MSATQEQDEVKPCPFCGATMIGVAEGSSFRYRLAYCRCGASSPEVRVQTLGEGTKEQWEEAARLKAIVAWNSRYDDNAGQAR